MSCRLRQIESYKLTRAAFPLTSHFRSLFVSQSSLLAGGIGELECARSSAHLPLYGSTEGGRAEKETPIHSREGKEKGRGEGGCCAVRHSYGKMRFYAEENLHPPSLIRPVHCARSVCSLSPLSSSTCSSLPSPVDSSAAALSADRAVLATGLWLRPS